MRIWREDVLGFEMPYGGARTVRRTVFAGADRPKLAVVAGIHGDELDGLYLCQRLMAWLDGLSHQHPQALLGRVDLYPAANPLGTDVLAREMPPFEADLNRAFPGRGDGSLPERVAECLLRDLEGSALVVDVHGSNRFLREIPQLRLPPEHAETLLPLARHLNVELAWLQPSPLRTTLRSVLNARGIPCIIVETGIAQRVHAAEVEQLLIGILSTCRALGILSQALELPPCCYSAHVVRESDISYVNSPAAGLFVPAAAHGSSVYQGQSLGHIVSPEEAQPLAEVQAPVAGRLFSLREVPMVYEGSLLGRIADAQALGQVP
jgi:predicted deacylase